METSLAQDGTRPQRTTRSWRAGCWPLVVAAVPAVPCVPRILAVAGEHRVDGLGRRHVVVGRQRLRGPVALDTELLEELNALARGRVPTTHVLTLSPNTDTAPAALTGEAQICAYIARFTARQTWRSSPRPQLATCASPASQYAHTMPGVQQADDRDLGPDWAAPTAPRAISARLELPGSKSITNRALVLAALAHGADPDRPPAAGQGHRADGRGDRRAGRRRSAPRAIHGATAGW